MGGIIPTDMRQGTQFGTYLLEDKIAQGGMAEIFHARKLGAMGFSREVCIKRILPALCSDRAFVEMFIDEAHTSSKLRHSNIVAIDDFGEIDGRLFACMEWVHGTDLASILKRLRVQGEVMPTDAALFVIVELLKALEYAHGKLDQGKALDIVHRDVTPHNVLVSFSGEVKLTDFGIAKASSRLHQTQGDVIKGKVSYMSPEQARGQSLDGRCDLWALGVVSFELLAGRRPFVGARESDVVLNLLQNRRPELLALRPELSAEVVNFVNNLLVPSPEGRCPCATAALDVLSPLIAPTAARLFANVISEYFPDQSSVVRSPVSLRPSQPTPAKTPANTPANTPTEPPLGSPVKDTLPDTPVFPQGPSGLEATTELPLARAITEKTFGYSSMDAANTDPCAAPEMSPPPPIGEVTPDDLTDVDQKSFQDSSHPRTPEAVFLLERARTDQMPTAAGQQTDEPPEVQRGAVTVSTISRVEPELFEPPLPLPVTASEPPHGSSHARWAWLMAAAAPLLVGAVGFALTRSPRPRFHAISRTTHPVLSRAEPPVALNTPVDSGVMGAEPRQESVTGASEVDGGRPEAPGWLTVVVRPWGAISVDGRACGDSRAVQRLAPGRHRVQVVQGANTRTESVVLRPAERRQLVIEME